MKFEMESNLMNGYIKAYELACAEFLRRDPLVLCQSTQSTLLEKEKMIIVTYLNSEYHVNCTDGEVTKSGSKDAVTTTVKLLIMHYLLNAKTVPKTNKFISFRDVKGGGMNYFSTFEKRAITPLRKTFDKCPDNLITAGEKLGGIRVTFGDASVTINIFPLIPVTYVVWLGDDEISSSATILFDENVNKLLPCEDIVLVASFGVYALMKSNSEV